MVDRDLQSILLLEDEAIIAIDVEETLLEAGYGTVTTRATRADALAWLEANTPHAAVIDPHLRDGTCGDVVAVLVERGIPFLTHSGDRERVAEENEVFRSGAWVAKPCPPAQLIEAIDNLFG